MDFDPPESVRPLLDKIETLRRRRRDARRARGARARLLAASARSSHELRAQVQGGGPVGAAAAEGARRARARRSSSTASCRERLGRSPLGHYVFGCQAPDAGNMEILHKYGTAEQKATWLEPLARGEIRSCFSMTEPENPGSQPDAAVVHARARDGDDYVIDGHKWFTTAADGAAFAIVMAVTNPDAPPHARASMIIVPTDTPGFELVRNITIMGDAGAGWAQPRRDLVPRRAACRVGEPARPRGRGLPDRAGAARPRPHPSLHALDRHLRARVRHDVPRTSRAARSTTRRRSRRARSRRRGSPRPRRDRRRAPHGAPRRVDDREEGLRSTRATRSR